MGGPQDHEHSLQGRVNALQTRLGGLALRPLHHLAEANLVYSDGEFWFETPIEAVRV
jgi:hypothetical protein